jgi:hypothetical protein
MAAMALENFISLEEIRAIKDYYADKPFEKSGLLPGTDRLQWENSPLAEWIKTDILHDKLVKLLGPDYKMSPGCGVFQRCSYPFAMHVDSKKRIDKSRLDSECETEGKSLLIPLDEGPHFNTVFWKEKFYDEEEMYADFARFSALPAVEVKNNHLGDRYNLAYCFDDPRRKIYNHYELDYVYHWKLGTAGFWDRNQIHAATDFTEHHQYKDAVTIFFE